MTIGAVSSINSPTIHQATAENHPEETLHVETTQHVLTDEVVNHDTAEEEIIDSGKNDAKVKGVIRNLMNGHFKGVADVRLRINFHEEIAAMEEAQRQETSLAEAPKIIDSFSSGLTSLLEKEALESGMTENINSIQGQFTIAFGESLAKLENGELDSGAFRAQVTEDFDDFKIAITDLYAPEEPIDTGTINDTSVINPESIEAPLATDLEPEEDVPAFNHELFLSELTSIFMDALDNFAGAIANRQVLPEISPPSGNGKAYDKFMTIYNELNNQIEPTTPEIELVSTE